MGKTINEMEVRKVSEVMKTKMEMWDIGSWMGGKQVRIEWTYHRETI